MSIDFGALRQQASEFLDKAEAARENHEEAVVETPAEPVAPKSTTPEGTDPSQVRVKGSEQAPAKQEAAKTEESADETAVDESAAKALEIADDQLVSVLVDGEPRILPWKEAKGKISGGMKFTQNSQKLAQERKAFEEQQAQRESELAQLKAERDGMRQFLTSPQVLEYAQKHFGGQAQAQPTAAKPDEIATIGDAQTIAQRQFAEMQQAMEKRLQETEKTIADKQARLEFERQQAAHAVVLDSTVAEIFSKNPILKAFPQSEEVLRWQVAQLAPKTEKEAIEAFHTVAAGIVEELGKFQKQTKTAQVIAKAKEKLESKSIEPAGGSAPQVAPTNFKNPDGSVNWNTVRNNALAALG